MYNLKIRNFILSHDNWEELLQAPPYNLIISRDEGYIMFKYSQIDSDFNDPIVQEARGIIFKESNWECVCHAFNKFGNYGESYVEKLDWDSVKVLEKIDGSLLKLFYDNNSWHISTNGTIDAFKSNTGNVLYPTFGDLFLNAIPDNIVAFYSRLDQNKTYMFELVSPYNRVVIPYENIELYYLGERDMTTGQEYFLPDQWCKSPRVFEFYNLQDVINAADKLPWDEEGYVCVDKDFRRCKIKSPSYVMAHYCRNNGAITRKRLIDVIINHEIAEFCIYANDYKDLINEVVQEMGEIKTEAELLQSTLNLLHLKELSRKEYASYVLIYPKVFHDFLFKNYERDITWEEYTLDWNANKWDKVLEQCEQYKIKKEGDEI